MRRKEIGYKATDFIGYLFVVHEYEYSGNEKQNRSSEQNENVKVI